jgi:hypothetical protein
VQGAELAQSEGDEVIYLRFIRNVGGARQNLLRWKFHRQFIARGDQFLLVARAEQHIRPFLEEMLRDDPAQSLAAAGDECVDFLELHERGLGNHKSIRLNTKSSRREIFVGALVQAHPRDFRICSMRALLPRRPNFSWNEWCDASAAPAGGRTLGGCRRDERCVFLYRLRTRRLVKHSPYCHVTCFH